ncbi:MAG: hypothetical protein LQ338_007304 [Usnochroma carphineum]|nr:MAG: hypothetical protein LQ338_007304 [Usnochroma carphineum]
MANIKFVPPQMGPVTNYSVRALRSGPMWLMLQDTGVFLTVLPYLPYVFFPMTKSDNKRENYLRFQSIRDTVIQALLFLIQTVLLVVFLPALWALPGLLFTIAAAICILLVQLLAWPTQGPRIRESRTDDETVDPSNQHPSERWIFVNGICTGSSGLQQNIDRLAFLFGRKVIGIHNQSYGFISDVLECMQQRCLSYNTMDVRIAYEIVKVQLVDDSVKKVVLIGHSQGGIIVSMVVDYLLQELSGEMMGKLEIYTFGSAASHFHNPPKTSTAFLPGTTARSSPCIPHIEHYANEHDMVPRWGVLYAIKHLVTNRYAGNVFIRMGASGHMFVEHYIDPIFSPPEYAKGNKVKPAIKVAYGSTNGHAVEEAADSYLDAIVDLDTETQMKRKKNSGLMSLVRGKNRRISAVLDARSANGIGVHAANGTVNSVEDGQNVIIAAPARGKTVKELSRLWKYLGGASPED